MKNELLIMLGFFLGCLTCLILILTKEKKNIEYKKPIEPTIKIETINSVSDTTYIYTI